jgi:hypothetical protein
VADVLGVPAVTLHTAQEPNATPSENLAGFAHIAHLMDASAGSATAPDQSADAFTQSLQSTTASVQAYLDQVAERLRPGESIRRQ